MMHGMSNGPLTRQPKWVKVISTGPVNDDWNVEDCLCQAAIPNEQRMDFQVREYDEKRREWRWKSKVTYHMECPIHGIHSMTEN